MSLLSTTQICEKLNISYDKFRTIYKKANIKPVDKIFKSKSYENFYDFNEVLTAFIQDSRTVVITEVYHIYESKMNYEQ